MPFVDTPHLLAPYLGCDLVAHLVHPEDEHTRERVADALLSATGQGWVSAHHKGAKGEPNIPLPIAVRSVRQNKTDLRGYQEALDDRLIAAAMAHELIVEEHELGTSGSGVKPRSLARVAQGYIDASRQNTLENFMTRIWRASLPVIHLALGLHHTHAEWLEDQRARDPNAPAGVRIEDIVGLPGFGERIVMRAMSTEPFVLRSSRINVTQGRLVSLDRWRTFQNIAPAGT